MDSDFVTGMAVGGGGRAAGAWKKTALQWEERAKSNEREAASNSGLVYAIFDVLKGLPVEARSQIYSALRDNLGLALGPRFVKRGLTPEEASNTAAAFVRELASVWPKAVSAQNLSEPRPGKPGSGR